LTRNRPDASAAGHEGGLVTSGLTVDVPVLATPHARSGWHCSRYRAPAEISVIVLAAVAIDALLRRRAPRSVGDDADDAPRVASGGSDVVDEARGFGDAALERI
jgi:hypothetical protein